MTFSRRKGRKPLFLGPPNREQTSRKAVEPRFVTPESPKKKSVVGNSDFNEESDPYDFPSWTKYVCPAGKKTHFLSPLLLCSPLD